MDILGHPINLILRLIYDILAVITVISIVFFQRRDPANALSWLLVLIFLPYIGFVLYLIFGLHYYKRKQFDVKASADREMLMGFVAKQKLLITEGRDRLTEQRLEGVLELANMLLNDNYAVITDGNEVRAFTDGKEKFGALLEAIRGAKDHIHMEYYIIRDDELGNQIVAALTEKAREGVEVRLLYDGLGNKIRTKGYRDLRAAGGKVSEFYRVLVPYLTVRINYRDHRKIAVIDGKVAFLGGFNIGDEYIGKGPLGHWRDTAVELKGEGARCLQLRFLLDWNFATKENLLLSDARYFPAVPGKAEGPLVQIVSGGPDALQNPIKEEYLKLTSIARKHIYIQTPYFIPDVSVMDALRVAALSGVDVRIMYPSRPNHLFVNWASMSYLGELVEAGVRVYQYKNGFIHAKTATVDGMVSSVGTANWDMRSFKLNFETNAVIYGEEFAEEQKRAFLKDTENSSELTLAEYKGRSIAVRIKECVSRLFSPLL
jgi:cardiolipin synthase